MTYQCKYVLKQIRKLSSNSNMALRFNSDGMIYPFTADTPFANCSRYKSSFLLIIQKLQSAGYITLSPKGVLRLTYDGLHPYQCLWDKLLTSVVLPIAVSFLTTFLTTLAAWLWTH